jgi:hypothetical protein
MSKIEEMKSEFKLSKEMNNHFYMSALFLFLVAFVRAKVLRKRVGVIRQGLPNGYH